MKTWLLLSRFERGGLERVQVNLAPALTAAGLDVWIVAGKFLASGRDMLPSGVPVLEISPGGRIMFVPRLIALLRRKGPDVVVTTSNDVGCLVLLLRGILFPRMKVVWTQHLSISAPWQRSSGISGFKLGLLVSLMRALLPKADAVIAVSHALADDMRSVLRFDGPIHAVHNPVLLPGFPDEVVREIDWPWSDRTVPTIVFVGRLVPVKRLDLLLAAFLAVKESCAARLLIVGEGVEQDSVQDFIARHNLGDAVRLVGHQDNPLPWIRASSVLVLPSDYEGFGNVLVEAMACGTQVISTDCPDGPAEILGNGRYGQLVPPGDVPAMADAIRNALSGRVHVSSSVLMSRARDFGLERAAHAYLHVIESVAGETG